MYIHTVIDYLAFRNATVGPFIVLFDAVPPGDDRENER